MKMMRKEVGRVRVYDDLAVVLRAPHHELL